MAIGEAAAAAGMELVPGSLPANQLDTEENRTRDYIAQHTQPVRDASASSSAPAGTLVRRDADSSFGVPTPLVPTHPANKAYVDGIGSTSADPGTVMRRNSNGQTAVASPTTGGMAANKQYVDDNDNQLLSAVTDALAGKLDSTVYSRTLSGSYRNVYVASDGTLGWVPSSRELKKNIKNWTPDRQAILAMQLVQFQYKVAIDPSGAIQHGLIAEQLDELGLDWLVDYGTTGTPQGIRYDLLSLALLSVVQDHEARIAALEARA